MRTVQYIFCLVVLLNQAISAQEKVFFQMGEYSGQEKVNKTLYFENPCISDTLICELTLQCSGKRKFQITKKESTSYFADVQATMETGAVVSREKSRTVKILCIPQKKGEFLGAFNFFSIDKDGQSQKFTFYLKGVSLIIKDKHRMGAAPLILDRSRNCCEKQKILVSTHQHPSVKVDDGKNVLISKFVESEDLIIDVSWLAKGKYNITCNENVFWKGILLVQ